jgi:hypothetical protein
MSLQVEDLEDQSRFRQILAIPYSELVDFVIEYIRKRTSVMVFFWFACLLFLGISIIVRIDIAGYFPLKNTFFHSVLGLIIFPLLCIPLHEGLHVIPFFITGARKIRIGVDLKQYIFYVTAHRHVATSAQFTFVALIPFIIINLALLFLVLLLPGLWKWSLSLFLFVHTTMCAGDFALLNFMWLNRRKKIYTWDDADQKMAYFYEEI